MNLANHRVPAFSLIEMLVVMVLSSIMVGIIYFVFYTVNSYQLTLARKYSEVETMNSVYWSIAHDFDRSEYVMAANANELRCHLQYTGAEISYSFFPAYILRKQAGRVDSLVCPVNLVVFLFQKKPVGNGLIEEVQVETNFFTEVTMLIFYKQYDAAVLVKNIQHDQP